MLVKGAPAVVTNNISAMLSHYLLGADVKLDTSIWNVTWADIS